MRKPLIAVALVGLVSVFAASSASAETAAERVRRAFERTPREKSDVLVRFGAGVKFGDQDHEPGGFFDATLEKYLSEFAAIGPAAGYFQFRTKRNRLTEGTVSGFPVFLRVHNEGNFTARGTAYVEASGGYAFLNFSSDDPVVKLVAPTFVIREKLHNAPCALFTVGMELETRGVAAYGVSVSYLLLEPKVSQSVNNLPDDHERVQLSGLIALATVRFR